MKVRSIGKLWCKFCATWWAVYCEVVGRPDDETPADADGKLGAGSTAAALQLNEAAITLVGLPQVLALFEKAPSTEARRNLFCVIFDAVIAHQTEVRQATYMLLSLRNEL